MRKLSLILGAILLAVFAMAQENPHGETFAFSCTDCHTTDAWVFSDDTAAFSHDTIGFELEGQHIFADCKACHETLVFSEAKSNCMDCHTDMHNNTVGTDCAQCHNSDSWIVTNTTEIHQQVGFPLLGEHNVTDCASCHTGVSHLEFSSVGIECIDCHRQDYEATTNPNHVEAGLSTNCVECHKVEAYNWTSVGFNHDFFPLTKGHQTDDCAACHTNGLFEPVSTDCFNCHQQDFNAAVNPSHQLSGFTTNCAECHTTDAGWEPAEFDIHDDFYFPVYSGEHQGEWESCSDCHSQNNYNTFTCVDCHEHNRSEMDEEHGGINGYSYSSLACYSCHPMGREEGAFNHESTGFQLKGAHAQTNCIDCHTNGFASTTNTCSSCHTSNYNEAQQPVHTTAGIASECEVCHTEDGWSPSQFNHVVVTGFGLTGGHFIQQCAECHVSNTTTASSECITCHQENYNSAENHVASNFPTDCLQCHTTNNWESADFDHSLTNFALTGSHVATECSACHSNGYAGTSTLCNSCHADNYDQAQNPGHTAAGISNECEACHSTIAWVPSDFEHVLSTGFALTGGHSIQQCSECHVGNTTSATSECITCHQENYNSAENHVASNYPTDCLQCHSTNNWEGAEFDHNLSNFPLTGAHIATECTACHTDGYARTSTVCSSCHLSNYNEAVNPSHISLGIQTNCEECHTTAIGWEPAQFPIHGDFYVLNGAHATIANSCALCHGGDYLNTPNNCFACHTTDYNSTIDPAHAAAQFPTDCEACHSETAWEPSTFQHDAQYFPIYSGRHQGEWNSCATCHTQPANYSIFSCITCHEHSQANADSHHDEVGNYVYTATSCFDCHPTGRAEDD